MAHANITVLTHPSFPQVLTPALHQLVPSLRRFDAPIYCEYELPEFGGELCARVATIHHLDTHTDCCGKHFAALEVGRG